MKFFHLSDLHLGKRVNEFSMLEDQIYILDEIVRITEEEQPDGVLIAGDVYDKSMPSAEAVQLFDDFLYRLMRQKVQVFIISGNHDSAERVAFGGRLMEKSGVYVSPVYDGTVTCVELKDEYGTVHVHLLPFLKPSHVRRYFQDAKIESYSDAIRTALEAAAVDTSERNLLVTHQFVTGAARSESEEISVGGSDNVDVSVFQDFDYVALGHLHGPQSVERETVRYCGTLLKYSFSESRHEKSVTVVECKEKGDISLRMIPLIPKHDLRELKGTYMELTSKSFYEGTATDDYLHITLTDEDDIPDAVSKLRIIYPNLMKMDYDNQRTRTSGHIDGAEAAAQKSPLALFAELYEKQNNQSMSEEQCLFCQELIEKIWEGEA